MFFRKDIFNIKPAALDPEAETAEDAPPPRGQVPELHPHDVAHALGHGPLGQPVQAGVELQLPQGHHGPQPVLGVGLLNLVQPQAGQVDGGVHAVSLHLQPKHAAQNHIVFLLTERVGLLQAPGSDVILDRQHSISSLLVAYLNRFISSAPYSMAQKSRPLSRSCRTWSPG